MLESRGLIGGEQGNYQLVNYLSASNQLVSSLSNQVERVDRGTLNSSMMAMANLGGGWNFNDPRFAQNFMAANSFISSGNEYMQAYQYGALDKVMPGSNFYDKWKTRREGLGGKRGMDLLASMIGEARGYGSKENVIMGLGETEYFKDMPADTLEKLLNLESVSKESVVSAIGQADYDRYIAEGANWTTQNLKDSAQIADAFAKGATDGVVKAGELFAKTVADKIDEVIDEKKMYSKTKKENSTQAK